MSDAKLKQAVKAALRELEDEKRHERIHDHIKSRLAQQTPSGKFGMAACGECGDIFEYKDVFALIVTPLIKKAA